MVCHWYTVALFVHTLHAHHGQPVRPNSPPYLRCHIAETREHTAASELRQTCRYQQHCLATGFEVMLLQAMSMGPEIAPSVSVGPLGPASGAQGFAMGLAVPGLTVPWGHAGYLWLATAASIAVHEVHTLQHLACCITAFPICALTVPAQPAAANAVPCDSFYTFQQTAFSLPL